MSESKLRTLSVSTSHKEENIKHTKKDKLKDCGVSQKIIISLAIHRQSGYIINQRISRIFTL